MVTKDTRSLEIDTFSDEVGKIKFLLLPLDRYSVWLVTTDTYPEVVKEKYFLLLSLECISCQIANTSGKHTILGFCHDSLGCGIQCSSFGGSFAALIFIFFIVCPGMVVVEASLNSINYRPQTKFGGKVIFSQACVKNSVHRGGVPGQVHPPRQVHPPGRSPRAGTPPWTRYTPQAGTHPWAGTPPRPVTPWAGTPPLDQVHPPGRYTPWACTPPSLDQVHPPGRYTPQTRYTPKQVHPPMDQVQPPGQVHPPGKNPPRPGTPLDQVPLQTRYSPSSACWEIRATSGRYASYWNAFLSCFCPDYQLLHWILKLRTSEVHTILNLLLSKLLIEKKTCSRKPINRMTNVGSNVWSSLSNIS